MRYTDSIAFVRKIESHYDPLLGEETSGSKVSSYRFAHVSRPSMEQSELVFGDLRFSNIIVHMKRPFNGAYDYLVFNDEKYYFQTQKTVGSRQMIFMKGDV